MARRLGIGGKIVFAFLGLFAAVYLVAGYLIASRAARHAAAQVEREMRFALRVAAGYLKYPHGTAINLRQVIEGVREAAEGGFDLVVVPPEAAGVAHTFGGRRAESLAQAFMEWYRSRLTERSEPKAGTDGAAGGAPLPPLAYRTLLEGEPYRVLYHPKWSARPHVDIFVVYSEAEITAAQWRAVSPIVVVGLVALGLVAVLGTGLGRHITRPLRQLSAAALRLSGGRWNEEIQVKTHDELADLAQAFRDMVAGLRESQASLVKSERLAAVGQMATAVAHEIRNPLTSMRLNVEMLGERAAGAAEKRACQAILQEIERLSLQVEELLTFARPTRPRLTETNLNEIIEDVLGFLKPQLDHAHVELVRHLQPDLPRLRVDPGKVRQALANLVLNGAEAIVRSGRLIISSQAVSDGVEIAVRDTGRGIPPQHLERVFDPFFSTKDAGRGLGLAITKQIVEEHQGIIEVESGAGGTTFRLRLPGTAAG